MATRLASFSAPGYGKEEEESTTIEDQTQVLTSELVERVEDKKFENDLYLELTEDLQKRHRAVSADRYDEETT